jgi:site-specific DNA-methyltransferase (adenine-specific)
VVGEAAFEASERRDSVVWVAAVTARTPADPGARLVPIGSLKHYPGNPRRHDLGVIRESLRLNGQYRPVVVRQKTRHVLAGNGTVAAAKQEGWEEVWATFVDCDAKTARRIVLVDNRANDLAGYDEQALLDLIGELPELEGSGFSQQDVDALIASAMPERPAPADEAPERPAEPATRPGDLYLLGEHRLLCGDATAAASYGRLLGKEQAELMWTDPPYGVSYVGKTAAKLTIQNDARGRGGLAELLRGAFAAADRALRAGAAIYVAHPAGALSVTFGVCFLGQGWRLHETLVWVKDSIVVGHSDYHYRHEPILYGYKPGPGRWGRGGKGWFGDNAQASVLEVARPKASRDHPTMKPVGLVEIGVRNSSRPGGVVLDPFGGSGSTLMACEATGRRARLVELDPGYCDVIVRRWEHHTGREASRG